MSVEGLERSVKTEPEPSLAGKAVRGALWISGAQYISFVFILAAGIALARILGPTPFGVFAIGVALAEILFLLASVSFSQALVQFREDDESLFSSVLVLTVILSVVICVVGLVAYWALAGGYAGAVLTVFLALTLTRAIGLTGMAFASVWEREFKYRQLAILRLSTTIISLAAAVALAIHGAGVWSLVARETAGSCLILLVGIVLIRPSGQRGRVWQPNWPIIARVLKFGWRYGGVRALETVFQRLDALVLGRVLPQAQLALLGCYAQSRYLTGLPYVLVESAVSTVAYRTYVLANDSRERLGKYFTAVQFWLARLLLPAALVTALWPKSVLWVLWGDKWLAAAPFLAVLAVYVVVLPIFGNLKMLLMAVNNWRGFYICYGLLVALFCPFVVWAAMSGQLVWAAWGVAVGLAGACVLAAFFAKKHIEADYVRIYFPPAVVAVGIGFAWSALGGTDSMPSRIVSLWPPAVAVAAYAAVLGLIEGRQIRDAAKLLWEARKVS